MEVKRKRLTREQKREQAVVDLINQMFIIAGHDVTYDDIKDRKDDWYTEWTMTVTQSDEWKAWGKKYIMKNLNKYAKQAESEMQWFNLQFGLKYSDYGVES